jgi:hypothetical protein
MIRLSQILFAATALAAVPLTAFAEDAATDPPADPNAGGGGDGTAVAPVEGGGAAMTSAWSRSVIDRPLTVLKGKLGAAADLAIVRFPGITVGTVTSDASTGEALRVGAGYGISDKLEVGGSYAFALHPFEIKGTLTLFGAFALMHSAKLDLGASADLAINLAGSSTTEAIHAGLAVRYKVAPKFAVFTGMPWAPGPLGQHLTIGLNSGAAKSFALPVGFGMQATPELFAYVNTQLFSLLLSDPGTGGKRFNSIADATPLTLGAFYSVNKNIDAAVSFGFSDVQHAGDTYAITVGARYFN